MTERYWIDNLIVTEILTQWLSGKSILLASRRFLDLNCRVLLGFNFPLSFLISLSQTEPLNHSLNISQLTIQYGYQGDPRAGLSSCGLHWKLSPCPSLCMLTAGYNQIPNINDTSGTQPISSKAMAIHQLWRQFQNCSVTSCDKSRGKTHLVMISLFLSHLPRPVGSVEMAGPPDQNVQAGYMMS